MEPMSIAALIAMVVGAGIQYKANTDAARRVREETQRGLMAQADLQKEAEKRATDTAQSMAAPERVQEQAALADQLTEQFMAPVSESQNIRAQQQTTQGNVSNEYTQAKAASDLNTVKSAQAMARLLGRTTSANRLRMNEGVRILDAGTDLDRLGSFSRGRQAADQIAIQEAGQVDPGMTLAASLLQAAGSAGLMSGPSAASTGTAGSGLSTASGSTAGTSASGLYGTQTGSGTALFAKNGAGSGMTLPKSFTWP